MLTLDKINYSDGTTFTNLVDMIYPVGSIYMSVDSKSPAELFGNGTS